MKYKLISCDLDDTLLRHDNSVSKRDLGAIHEFERRGGVFMPNTGRMHLSAYNQVRRLSLRETAPISSFQGAMIRELGTGGLIYYTPLGNELGVQVIKDAEEAGMFAQAYDLESLYCAYPAADKAPYAEAYAERCGVTYIKVPCLSDYMIKTRMDCIKVIIMDEPENVARYLAGLSKKFGGAFKVNTSTKHLGEVIANRAGKDIACDVICKRMGITIDECIAVGDSMNDYDMIRHAGLGVAVANARKEVLDAADYITDSHENDGVAKVIEKFCL